MESDCFNLGSELVFLGVIISIVLACQLNNDDQDILANFLQAVGQNLSLINAVGESSYCMPSSAGSDSGSNSSAASMSDMQNQIDELKSMIVSMQKKN